MDVAVDRADLGAEHALQRHRGRRDQGDLETSLACGRGDLGADPARADDDERRRRPGAAQRIAVASVRR